MNAVRDDFDRNLIELLRSADAEAPPPRLRPADDLAGAARSAAAARDRVNRAAAGSALVLALVGSVAFGVARSDLHRRRISDADRARLRSELAVLSHQADVDQLSASRMTKTLQQRKQVQQRSQLYQQPGAVEKLALQRDQAAMTMFLDAREIESKSKSLRADRALQQYRRIVELFPTSSAAGLARQRINALQPKPTEPKHPYPGSM